MMECFALPPGGTLSAAESAAWMPLVAVLQLLPNALDQALQAAVGRSSLAFYALLHLHAAPNNTAGLSEIAACLSAGLPRMSRTITKLESEGLITRSNDDADGRAVNITLTALGRQTIADAVPVHDQIVHDLALASLSDEQLRQLRGIAETLITRLHPDIDAPVDRQRTRVPIDASFYPRNS